MDRNELVEKAAEAMHEARPLNLDQEDDEWETLPDDWKEEWRDGARAALDAILPDVIEHVLEEATEAMGRVEIEDRPGDYHKPDLIWVTDAQRAIRGAVLGDALKGGK